MSSKHSNGTMNPNNDRRVTVVEYQVIPIILGGIFLKNRYFAEINFSILVTELAVKMDISKKNRIIR